MPFAYRITEQQQLYFITATIHQWVDVFTRPLYADILLDSFRFAQKERGMHFYGWVLMPNHFHAMLSCDAPYELSNVLRDMKKFSSSQTYTGLSLSAARLKSSTNEGL
jgi:putative transposase